MHIKSGHYLFLMIGLVAIVAINQPLSASGGLTDTTVNWPQFHFDASHTGFNPSEHILSPTTVRTLPAAWKYMTGNGIQSSPAIANGILYIGSNDNNVYALNATTGALIWKYTTGCFIA